MNTNNSVLEIVNASILLRKEGFIHIYYKSHLFSLSENIEIFDMIDEKWKGIKVPLLIGGENFYNHDAESKTFFASEKIQAKFPAIAFLANNQAQKMVIKFFIQMYKPKAEVRFFFSEEEAVDWLLPFVK
jgi:hypothetical protein